MTWLILKWRNNEVGVKEKSGAQLTGRFGTGRLLRARVGKKSNNNTKEKDNYNRNPINNKRSIIHVSFLLPKNLDNKKLNNQLPIVPSDPHPNMNQFILSTPETIGVITMMPKITWPALSRILASLNSSSSEKTGFFEKGGLIKTIYAKNNMERKQLSVVRK